MKLRTILPLLMLLIIGITVIAAQTIDSAANQPAAPQKDSTAQQSQAAPKPTAPATDTVQTTEHLFMVKSKKDTILLVTDREQITSILSSVSRTVKKSRIQGYGGAGGFGQRIAVFNMNPVKDLVDNDIQLNGIRFPTLDGGFSLFPMSGGLGYGGLGHGIRIGGGGWGGSRKYTSSPYRRSGSATQDSIAQLSVNISFGGVLIEKATVRDNWNILVGGMIGGGGLSVEKTVMASNNVSAFSSSGGSGGSESARTALMTMELHGGATYTIVSWMHIGGDASAMFYSSINGFELTTGNSFFGVLPSLGIRIIFGNLG